jgi:hypothetical protein
MRPPVRTLENQSCAFEQREKVSQSARMSTQSSPHKEAENVPVCMLKT